MSQRNIAATLFAFAGVMLAGLLIYLGVQKMNKPSARPERHADVDDDESPKKQRPSASATAVPSASTVAAGAATWPKTIDEALRLSEPGDARDDVHPSVGSMLTWSVKMATWKTFFPGPSEVKPSVVVKDIDSNRGKRICGRGRVEQIQVAPNTGGRSLALINDWRNRQLYSFATAFPSGDLVANSNAVFCGFVIGHRSFSNVSGGTTLTIQLVGMYDLPETHPKDEPALTF